MVEKKKARKRAAKPKASEEEPQVAPPETEGTIEEAEGPLPFSLAEEDQKELAVLADGTLLREDGEAVVYVMRDGQRRPFANAGAFTACGFGWNEIVVVPPKELDPIPVGPAVTRASDLPRERA